METLFSVQSSNFHQSLLLKDPARVNFLSGAFNRDPLLQTWSSVGFELRTIDKKSAKVPTICTVYISGALAFPAHMKEALFPVVDGLEFLPINVGNERWLFLNCLNSVKDFDEKESQVWRGLEGQIFMILELAVTDPRARNLELFTLDGSNHAQLFVRSSFKDRVEKLGLEGITFDRIGEVI